MGLTSAEVSSHPAAGGKLPLEFYGLGMDGKWKLLSTNVSTVFRDNEDHRQEALWRQNRRRARGNSASFWLSRNGNGVWMIWPNMVGALVASARLSLTSD
jgi:hypothetical protein